MNDVNIAVQDARLWADFHSVLRQDEAASRGIRYYDGWDFQGRGASESSYEIRKQRINLIHVASGAQVASFDNFYVSDKRMTHTAFLECLGRFPEVYLRKV